MKNAINHMIDNIIKFWRNLNWLWSMYNVRMHKIKYCINFNLMWRFHENALNFHDNFFEELHVRLAIYCSYNFIIYHRFKSQNIIKKFKLKNSFTPLSFHESKILLHSGDDDINIKYLVKHLEKNIMNFY